MNLTEAAVATSALAIFTTVSLQSFTSSMKVVGRAKLRDDVSSAITSDLAAIRRAANQWQIDDTTINSEGVTIAAKINYTPGADMCTNGTIALDFLKNESAGLLPASEYGNAVESESITTRTKSDILPNRVNVTLTRTISSESSNYNLLKVSYTATSSALSNSDSSVTIVMPAQSWCDL